MTDLEVPKPDNPVPPPVEQLEQEGAGFNLVDLIKQDLQELASNKDVYIPFIGHEKSGLAAKYRMPESGKELDGIAAKVEKENKDRFYRNLWTTVDTMIALCDGLYVKPPGVEEYVELDPQELGQPVRFDSRMAAIVGLPEDSRARVIVRKIFEGNDAAIMNHGERLQRWLTNTKADLDAELWELGNR